MVAELIESPPSLLAVIERAARDTTVDVAKMQALLDMQRTLMADQARQEFNAAFARLKPRLPRIKKNGEVRYPVDKNKPDSPTKLAFKYGKYEDIEEAISELLNTEGFWLSYDTEPQGNGTILVKGALLHRSGHEKAAQIGPLPLDTSGGKNNLQAAASTFSYGKRYCATMLLDLVFEGDDDDGVRGGTQYIGEEQIKRLQGLIAETKSNLAAFCRVMGVGALADIEAQNFAQAINALLAKKRKQNPEDRPPARAAAALSPANAEASPTPQRASAPFDPKDYSIPMVMKKNGKPDLRAWAVARLLPKLLKATKPEEVAWIQGDNHEHIDAYKATLTPIERRAFEAELKRIAEEVAAHGET